MDNAPPRARVDGLDAYERYQTLFEYAPDAYYLTDLNGRFLDGNRAAEKLAGYPRAELIGRSFLATDLLSPEEGARAAARLARTAAGRPTGPDEFVLQRKDGSPVVIEIRTYPATLQGERVVLGIARDITERRRAEDALRQSEARYRTLVEHIRAVVYTAAIDEAGTTLFVNPQVEAMLGLSPGECARDPNLLRQRVHPEDRPRVMEALARSHATGEPLILEYRMVAREGRVVWVQDEAVVVRDPEGAPLCLQGVMYDITGRRQAVEALRESEERYRSLVELSPDLIAVHSGGTITYMNPAGAKLLGAKRPSRLVGVPVSHMVHPDDREGVARRIAEALRTGAPAPPAEERLVRLDGSTVNAEIMAVPITVAGEVAVQVVVRDISERKRVERELVRLRKAVDASGEVVFMTDREGIITYVNPEFTRLYGYTAEEVVGKVTPRILKSGLLTAEVYEHFWQTILSGQVTQGELVNKTKDGRMVPIEGSANPILDDKGNIEGFLAVQRDISERNLAEEELRQAQKLEAVGRLAGGIAHDFNNLLTPVMSYSDLLIETLPDDPRRQYAEQIARMAERAAALTRQLLAFSRREAPQLEIIDLNAVVTDLQKMLDRLIGEDVQILTVLDPDLGLIEADAGQIEQVIANLAVNARDAMPHGGLLRIETANEERGEEARAQGISPGAYVRLAVRDTGCGMDAETQARIFEPFFTTKAPGKGTGLGLSTVYGIIAQAGGHISVSSEPGQGATFTILLPRVERTLAATRRDEDRGRQAGTETILVVEDEPVVRESVCTILEANGYRVHCAGNGAEALRRGASEGEPIHLLLTDVVLPGMSGRELAERLCGARPDIKVLFMSGYLEDAVLQHGISQGDAVFLQKPFAPGTLVRKVREVLDMSS